MANDYRSSVIWATVEAQLRSKDLIHTLPAIVHDPLWTLSTQWRIGEFRGEDTGFPLLARAHVRNTRITRYAPKNGDVQPISQDVPIECIIEREQIEIDLSTRLQMGKYWFKLLALHGMKGKYESLFSREFPIVEATTPEQISNAEALQVRLLAHGRTADGYALYDFLTTPTPKNATHLEDYIQSGTTNFDSGDITGINTAISEFTTFYNRLYSQPNTDESAWDAGRMEYEAKLSMPVPVGSGTEQKVIKTQRFPGGRLNWYEFDTDPDTTELIEPEGVTVDDNVITTFKAQKVQASVNFSGIAPERWHKVQQGNYNYAAVQPDKTDVFSMIVNDFIFGYSNDWSILPFEIDKGSYSKVKSIVVKDVFGDYVYAGGEYEQSQPGYNEPWTIFTLNNSGNPNDFDNSLFIPPVSAKQLTGEPLEVVNLLRDDAAAMAWAVEKRISNEIGGSTDASAAALKLSDYLKFQAMIDPITGEEEEGPGEGMFDFDNYDKAKIRYKLMNNAPENWIPLIPKHVPGSDSKTEYWRAKIPRILHSKLADEGDLQFIEPRTRIMRHGLDTTPNQRLSFKSNDVPSEGVLLSRSYRRTRWYDGSIWIWMGRNRNAGSGTGLSGLEFDVFLKTNDHTPLKEIDMANLSDAQRRQLLQSLSPSFIYQNLTAAQREVLLKSLPPAEYYEAQSATNLISGYNSITDTNKKLDVYFGTADHPVFEFTSTTQGSDDEEMIGTSDDIVNTIDFVRIDTDYSHNYENPTFEIINSSSAVFAVALPFTAPAGFKVRITFNRPDGQGDVLVKLLGKYQDDPINIPSAI